MAVQGSTQTLLAKKASRPLGIIQMYAHCVSAFDKRRLIQLEVVLANDVFWGAPFAIDICVRSGAQQQEPKLHASRGVLSVGLHIQPNHKGARNA